MWSSAGEHASGACGSGGSSSRRVEAWRKLFSCHPRTRPEFEVRARAVLALVFTPGQHCASPRSASITLCSSCESRLTRSMNELPATPTTRRAKLSRLRPAGCLGIWALRAPGSHDPLCAPTPAWNSGVYRLRTRLMDAAGLPARYSNALVTCAPLQSVANAAVQPLGIEVLVCGHAVHPYVGDFHAARV